MVTNWPKKCLVRTYAVHSANRQMLVFKQDSNKDDQYSPAAIDKKNEGERTPPFPFASPQKDLDSRAKGSIRLP